MRISQQTESNIRDLELWATLPDTRKTALRTHWNILNADYIHVADGLIYRLLTPKDITSRRFLIPMDLRDAYLRLTHDSTLLGGHRDATQVLAQLQPWVWWPTMPSDAAEYVASCHSCQLFRSRDKGPRQTGLLDVYYPMQRVSIDHIGPLPSVNGYTHLLIVIDHFTKYVWALPCAEPTGATTAKLLFEHVFCVFGPPEEVLCDRASTLLSSEVQALYDALHISALHSTAYHPQGHAVVERVNRTVQEMIGKTLLQLHTTWHQTVWSVTFAYNQCVHSSTGYSPFYLMFARDPKSPLEVLLRKPTPPSAMPEVSAVETYLIRVLDGLHAAFNTIRDSLLTKEAKVNDKNRALLKSLGQTILFNVGDLVTWTNALHTPGDRDTFAPRSLGPFRILQRYGAGCYKIEMLGQSGNFRIANSTQLTLYTGRVEHFLPDKDETLLNDDVTSS